MEKNSLKTLFKKLLALFFVSIIVISCGKGDGADNLMEGYPKDVTIRYEVSSTTNNMAHVTYTNETGSSTDLDNAALPFSIEVRKKVKLTEIVHLVSSIRVENNQTENVTAKIFIDNKLVDEKTARSNDLTVVGQAIHQFGN